MVHSRFRLVAAGLQLAYLMCLVVVLSLLPCQEPLRAKDASEEQADKLGEVAHPKMMIVEVASVQMVFVLIPKGKFMMGSPKTEDGHQGDENQHEVEITKPFYLAKYPVTQQQYKALMKKNPSYFQAGKEGGDKVKDLDTDAFPVESVSWKDAQAFCRAMRYKDKYGRKFRLPTEAEWEYACRAGTKTVYWFGDDPKKLGDHDWFSENSIHRTHVVGTKNANPWGLYDLHGNVWQWCQDVSGDYPKEAVTDPQGPNEGFKRMIRGGCWGSDAWLCRSAKRSSYLPEYRYDFLGFRVAVAVQ
jgi:formylglycine-generating enzyme required for sulfatase activity